MTAKWYVVTVSPDSKLNLSEALDELDAILLEKVCDDEGCPATWRYSAEEKAQCS